MTGYAVSYNRRHHRSGHLFQNTFKSILYQEDLYLKELVAYIHLNPLRAGIVAEFKELAKYAYGGHSVLMGNPERDFQDVDYVLRLFGDKVSGSRRSYQGKKMCGMFSKVMERIQLARPTFRTRGSRCNKTNGLQTSRP